MFKKLWFCRFWRVRKVMDGEWRYFCPQSSMWWLICIWGDEKSFTWVDLIMKDSSFVSFSSIWGFSWYSSEQETMFPFGNWKLPWLVDQVRLLTDGVDFSSTGLTRERPERFASWVWKSVKKPDNVDGKQNKSERLQMFSRVSFGNEVWGGNWLLFSPEFKSYAIGLWVPVIVHGPKVERAKRAHNVTILKCNASTSW